VKGTYLAGYCIELMLKAKISQLLDLPNLFDQYKIDSTLQEKERFIMLNLKGSINKVILFFTIFTKNNS
jgi:hypothetical protein